jgi:hypothetical protein
VGFVNVVCDYYCVYIEQDNSRWPGYCSARCRADARAARDRERGAGGSTGAAQESLPDWPTPKADVW